MVLSARVIQSSCSDATQQKRRSSPIRTRRERGGDFPGPKSGVLSCLVRKGTTSTKAAMWNRRRVMQLLLLDAGGVGRGRACGCASLALRPVVVFSPFLGCIRVQRVGGFRLVSAGRSRRRPGRAPLWFLSSFRSSCCCSCSLWRRSSSFSGWGLPSLMGSGLGFSLVVMDFLIGSLFGPFLRHLRVAGCPSGGEICGVQFQTFAASSFHPGGHSRSFFCSSQLQI